MDLENKETRSTYLDYLLGISIFCVGLSLCLYIIYFLVFMLNYLSGICEFIAKFDFFSSMMIFWVGGWMFYQIACLYRRIYKLGFSRRQIKRKQFKQISLYKKIILLSFGQMAWTFLWAMGFKIL